MTQLLPCSPVQDAEAGRRRRSLQQDGPARKKARPVGDQEGAGGSALPGSPGEWWGAQRPGLLVSCGSRAKRWERPVTPPSPPFILSGYFCPLLKLRILLGTFPTGQAFARRDRLSPRLCRGACCPLSGCPVFIHTQSSAGLFVIILQMAFCVVICYPFPGSRRVAQSTALMKPAA